MTAIAIQAGFPQFADTDGTPLNNGKIYIGEVNKDPVANPIPVFFDQATTIPAAQPLDTSNGYLYYQGTPAAFYTAGAYSIKVINGSGVTVYEAPEGIVTEVTNTLEEITQYLGAFDSAPSTRGDGTALQVGDIFFDTTVNLMKVYDGSSFIGFAGPYLPLTGGTIAGDVIFNDSEELRFGTGNDLRIYHDGSNSFIKELGTGNLFIQGDTNVNIGSNQASSSLQVSSTGAVFRGSNSTVATLTTTGMKFEDGKIISVGADDDLKIYHDGNNSYIKDTGTGNLNITASTDVFVGTDNSTMANFDSTGPVDLYHNNSKKFETTSAGATITGNATVTNVVGAQTFNASSSIDTPQIEVTTLKARDGTAAGSIADSTGVVTLGSAVLTTADINGGTADNVVIGGSTAAAGTFTTGTIATADINGGTIDGSVIGGSTAAAGTFTTLNATTVDATNIEVTNIKAKDGTAAGSIADSTGVTTLNSAVLTTADINNGTIDSVIIGGSTAAAGTFTTGTIATADINGGAIDGTVIGGSTAAAGTFTSLNTTGDLAVGQTAEPQATLDVHGNALIKDTLQIGETQGGTTQAALDIRGDNSEAGNFTASVSAGVMNVTAVNNATLAVGDVIYSANAIPANTFIKSFGTGSGGIGTYNLSQSFDLNSVTLRNSAKGSLTASFTNADTSLRAGQPIGIIEFNDADSTNDGAKGFLVCGAQDTSPSSYLAFGTHTSGGGEHAREVARFDETGKLLIGALISNDALNHIELRDTGEIRSASLATGTLDAGVSTFTKSGGSGTIAEFYNDTNRVGFIRDRSEVVSSLVLDTRTDGVGITASSNRLIPTDLNGNVTSNIADLGGVNDKWKDLYLGGGIYLGGDTAAANKLEDYEEGTWGPVFRDEVTGGNVASGQAFNGSYTRIGNQCTLHMRVINLDPDTGVTGTNNVYITNLPFAASDESSNYRYVGSMESTRISYSGSIQPRITENTNYMVISKTNQSGSTSALQWDDITDAQADMYVSITYTV